jgi:uncharacterized membrane protein YtjA (UPF0391 family)
MTLLTLERRLFGGPSSVEVLMLYWAAVFFIIAIIAGYLGFGGVAVAASGIAQTLFFVFLVIFLVALVMGLSRRRAPPI